jgi:hypothetical protein
MLERYRWCTQIFSGLNVSLHNNNIYLPISVFPFKVLLMTLFGWPNDHTTIWTILKVRCLRLIKCIPWFCSPLFSFSLMPSLVLGKEISHTLLCVVGKDVWNGSHLIWSQKVVHRQSTMSRCHYNQQMHQGSSRIYWCILNLPQHVSASHCHHQGIVVTSEATQVMSVLWMYMDYNLSSVVSCRRM